MDVVYKFAMEGEKYLESHEKERKESILKKSGAEFPVEANPQLYDQIFIDYFGAKHKKYFGSSPKSIDEMLMVIK
jgi:hypothetical protein